MRPVLITTTLALACLAAATTGFAIAQPPAPQVQPRPLGYLTDQTAPDASLVLPPAPAAGSDRYAADRAIFKATRALEGGPRWALAQNDVRLGVPDLEDDFSCALGVRVTPQAAPKLTLLLSRVGRDAGRVSNAAKEVFKRDRPFKIDGGAICTPRDSALDNSYDYPSGHATLAWTDGLILAELAPDRATNILTRARAFGESRVVCGVHNASAIEAGRTAGAITVAAINGSAEFRADLDSVRSELAGLRTDPAKAPDAARCTAEAALTAKTPYPY